MVKNNPRTRTFKARVIPYLIISLFALFYLYSCGPGNPSEEGGLHGTAAIGKPIKNATITVKSSDGNTVSTTTGPDGKYQISASGKAPFLLKVEFGNTVLYGTAYQYGTANIHPLTDLIIRNWYLVKGTNADTVFDKTGIIDPDPPNQTELDTIQKVLKIYLGALSLIQDWSQFDFITTEFTAYDENPLGFDLVLSMTEVSIDDNSKTGSPLSIARSPQLLEDKITITMFPSPEIRDGGTVLLESSATRDFNNPTILEQQQEIEDMLNQFADTVNSKACDLNPSDIQPYLINGFMWKGWDAELLANAFKNLVCYNDQKIADITITPEWTDYDEEHQIYTANLFIYITFDSEEQVQGIAGAKLGKENNNWVWLGDGLPAGIYVYTRVTAVITNGAPQWTGTRNIFVRDYLDQVSEITASGPSLDTTVPKICDDFTGSPYYCGGNPKLRIFWYQDNDLDNAIGAYNLILTMEGGATVNVQKSILYIPGKDNDLDSGDFPKFALGDTIHNLVEVCGDTLTSSVYTPTWISGLIPPWVDLLNDKGQYLGPRIYAQWTETPRLGKYNTFQVYIPCTYDGETVSNAFLDQYTFNEIIEGWGSTRVSWVFCPGGWCGCIDNDKDGYGENCELGPDCNDNDPNNWISCETCEDADQDDYYVNCDAYITILGPDCDDNNADTYPGAPENVCALNQDNNCDGQPDTDTVVYFPDYNLEMSVRVAIQKFEGEIWKSDLCELFLLDAWNASISNLTGIEYCINLQELDLWYNNISDLSPLANLVNLESLFLGANQITDISPLANLTNLRDLVLAENQITNISALANLTNLEGLQLAFNQISDISALANLTNLRMLYLSSNPLTAGISALVNLINLEDVYLEGCWITDLQALVDNPGIGTGDEIWVESNPLGLGTCAQIAELEARGATVYYDYCE